MTRYDHDIDDAIISYLYKNEKANFSQLLLQVGRLHKATSKKVLSSHLKKLEENRIILRDKEKPGVDRFSYLTKLTRQQVSLGIPVQVKSKREHKASPLDRSDIEDLSIKRKRLYQLLFFIASSGAGRLKPNPKLEPGNIVLYDADGKPSMYSYYNITGVGASDFSVEPREIIGQGGALTDVVVDLPDSEIAKLFKMLLKEKRPLIKPIGDVGREIRYGIANQSLADYIADCWVLFSLVQWRMEETWKYIRKPEKDEVEWYVFFYGKRKARSFFIEAEETRRDSKSDSKIRESFKERIRSFDNSIRRNLEGWPDEKRSMRPGIYEKYGKNIMKDYKFPAQVLLEMVYPKFLRELQKKKKI
jgi:hypothetical protein